ncbi:MAG TPA: selenium metabolism-associated LysR family transcriptional regulator [Patescibacteria group bacterium]|nr:selenium metabolism-associated LysR family transcriptional regulator [Patescibacteria group bacterium]
MDFKQIEAFVHVVRHKSFSRAADAIYLTQPTISAHISSLEKELGIKLVDRSGKDIEPTEAGILFYEHAVNLMNTRDNAIFSLSTYNNTIKGKVEIAASTVPSQIILPRLIKSFAEKYKDISFSITQMDSEEVAAAVLEKKYEIGIVGTKYQNSKLCCNKLADDKLVLIAPNNGKYAALNDAKIPFNTIAKENFIIRETGSGTRHEFERIITESGISKSSISIIAQMNSIEAIKQSVSMGLGVSIMSKLSVQDYVNCGLLKAFDIEGLELSRAFYLIYMINRPLSPLSNLFLKFICEQN